MSNLDENITNLREHIIQRLKNVGPSPATSTATFDNPKLSKQILEIEQKLEGRILWLEQEQEKTGKITKKEFNQEKFAKEEAKKNETAIKALTKEADLLRLTVDQQTKAFKEEAKELRTNLRSF